MERLAQQARLGLKEYQLLVALARQEMLDKQERLDFKG